MAVLAVVSWPLAPVPVSAADSTAGAGPTCGGEKATIVGTEGNDVIKLTPKHEVVVALGGDDRVYNPADTEENHSNSDPQPYDPPANDDVVCLGEGNDYAKGAHTVFGGPGNDTILHAEEVHAGQGDDTVRNDGCRKAVIYLDDGNDRFLAFGSYDEGWDPDDAGNSPYNKCKTANDEAHGGLGDDFIYGGDGDDHLFGDGGKDSLNGWMGKDTCVADPEDTTEYCELH